MLAMAVLTLVCTMPQLAFGLEPDQERIQILSGGRCLVRSEKLDCSAVAAYLRDQLKLGRGHLIRVRAGQSVDVSYQQLHALFDSLREAGFATYTGR